MRRLQRTANLDMKMYIIREGKSLDGGDEKLVFQ